MATRLRVVSFFCKNATCKHPAQTLDNAEDACHTATQRFKPCAATVTGLCTQHRCKTQSGQASQCLGINLPNSTCFRPRGTAAVPAAVCLQCCCGEVPGEAEQRHH
jgi:hypothetical protein